MKQWERIANRPDLDEDKAERTKANKSVLESKEFISMCEKANIKPTKRQASKYRRKTGRAYKFGKGLI